MHLVDVDSDGIFKDAGTIRADMDSDEEVWKTLIADKVYCPLTRECRSDGVLLAATSSSCQSALYRKFVGARLADAWNKVCGVLGNQRTVLSHAAQIQH